MLNQRYTEEMDDLDDFINKGNDAETIMSTAMSNFIQDYTKPEPEPDFWETDIKIVDSCGTIPKSIDVVVMPEVVAKIDALMNNYDRMEWLAYLVGDKETNTITDIVIPEQKVTPVNVFVEGSVDVPIVGVIHSHHDMGNNFSHTDDEFINANHDISLCVSKSGIQGQVRVKTECDKYALTDANVLQWNGGVNIDEFLKQADTLITVKSYSRKKMDDDIIIPTVETKNVVHYVQEYHSYIKDMETSSSFAETDKIEIGFLVSLLRSVNTQDFYDIEDIMYSGELEIAFSDECVGMVDELDVFQDTLSNPDLVEIKSLLDYLETMYTLLEQK